jgi:2-methylcitrate dehydratase PrpD
MGTSEKTITGQVAEWIVGVTYDDAPPQGTELVRNLVLDSVGNQFAGMANSTGRILSDWVKAQGGTPESSVTGGGFKTTAAYASLLNGATSHALENDDIANFSSHPNSPLTAAGLALGEKLDKSGRDVVLAWQVGWEVTAQTMKLSAGPTGNTLLDRGWFNQGFQHTLGVAALASKLLGLDVDQTSMALGHAASAMGGMLKNRGTDTKGFTAGSAAMHGLIGAELAAMGFTANRDILDGEIGLAALIGYEGVDPAIVLDGLGEWNLATRGSTIRLHACCGASHWSQDALQQILRRRPTKPDEVESIEVEIMDFLLPMMPYHEPATGLEGKYSLEYDLAAIVLDGQARIHQYTDAAVQRPEARQLLQRVTTAPRQSLGSRVVLRLTNGEELEETVSVAHGTPGDPLSQDEIDGKFHETAGTLAGEAQRLEILDLCRRLETLDSVRVLTDAASTIRS